MRRLKIALGRMMLACIRAAQDAEAPLPLKLVPRERWPFTTHRTMADVLRDEREAGV